MDVTGDPELPAGNRRDIGVQAKPVTFRSKHTMCKPSTYNQQTSPIKLNSCDVSLSPIRVNKRLRLDVDAVYTDSSSEESAAMNESRTTDSASEDSDHSELSSDDEGVGLHVQQHIKFTMLSTTRHYIKMFPLKYLGLPDSSYYIIDLISSKIQYKSKFLDGNDVVLIVLRKIRLNESFSVLGDCFGISKSHCAKLFSKYTGMISDLLKELIVWPEKEAIHRHLPVPFQARYYNVQSIIDCFEIEIEKPSKAVYQALTWSDYKKCNTLKYLVSATPDGLVNFVSEGYGGRVSDMILLEDSGYLDHVTPGMSIMADRGFKHIEKSVKEKGGTLIRPPSVSDGTKLDSASCKETKRIASLRIHIERLIRRIREFKYLTPHACVDIHVLGQVDSCVKIACGLINLQGALIK